MRFCDLGMLEFDAATSRSLGRRGSAALGVLLWADRPVSPDRLADAVWGEKQPIDAREALHVLVWRLRRVLEPDRRRGDPPVLLVRTPAGYVVLARDEQVDSRMFEKLYGEARSALEDGDAELALDKVVSGMALWRGHPLGDLGYEPWARPTATRLLELRTSAHELHLDALSRLGRDDMVVAVTEQLLDDHPTREGLWVRRVRALYRLGDQGEALRVVHRARMYLAEELGIDPGPELLQVERQILEHDAALVEPRAGAGAARVTGLPGATGGVASHRSTTSRRHAPGRPRSSFVGRHEEMELVHASLARHHLLTLTGPGGVGKSRLAVEVACDGVPSCDDGAVVVDLSSAAGERETLALAARGLGLPAGAQLDVEIVVAALRNVHLLVVLDNCERVLGAASSLAGALCSAGGPRVLATSRCPLGADGERVVALRPLGAPNSPDGDADPAGADPGAAAHPALELLLDRATAAGCRLDPSPVGLRILVELVTHLAGLPLAIELAASALGALDPVDLVRCLRAGADLPVAPGGRSARHCSLDALFAPSIVSCDPATRELLQRLSLLGRPFDLFAAQVLGTEDDRSGIEVARQLSALVHASLVMPDDSSGERRYTIIEPLRAAVRRLAVAESPVEGGARAVDWLTLSEP